MTTQTDIAMLKRDVDDLKELCKFQKEKIEALEKLDQNRMRAAVVVLGGVVVSLIIYIWTAFMGNRGL